MREDNFTLLDFKSDCIDMVISSYALWLTKEYRHLFQDCLGLKFNQGADTWGNRIAIDKADIVRVAIESGDLRIGRVDQKQLSIALIANLLKDYPPLLVQVDEYNLSWRSNYRKIHRMHYLLIHKYNKQTRSFLCTDTYPTKHNLILSQDEILKFALRIFYFDKIRDHVKGKDVPSLLITTLRKFKEEDEDGTILDRTRLLAEGISRDFNYAEEISGFEGIELIFVPIVWKLKNMEWSWLQFEYFLGYIDDSHMNPLINRIAGIRQTWEIISNMIIMRIVKKDNLYMADNMMSKFKYLLSEERDLIRKISEYVEA